MNQQEEIFVSEKFSYNLSSEFQGNMYRKETRKYNIGFNLEKSQNSQFSLQASVLENKLGDKGPEFQGDKFS